MTLRPVLERDIEPLARIGRRPEVARWWPDLNEDELTALASQSSDVVALAIELDGAPIGLVQWYEEEDPEYRHAALDVFLAPERHGHGLGPEALWVAARHLVDARGHRRLTIDPAAANERAVRAYRKVGFHPVGVLRAYQRIGDRVEDGLLMDLLAEELPAEPPS